MIRFEKVSKAYPGTAKPALDQVSIDIEKGEFVFLVGQSGSGKSTALRLVLRETRSTGGRVHVAGKDLNRLAGWKVPRLRRQIGTVFQDFRLLPNKTVSENVSFALQVIGKSRAEIKKVVPQTLELVGLDGKGERMPDELSGGEQQRVAVARAFVNRPMILIADEPTGNLDPTTSAGIMKLLDRINRTGTTVLMATHDAHVVDQLQKRVIELDDGHVVRDDAQGGYGGHRLMRNVFSELGQGLRRNVSMHIAVVLTIFVSMTLVGLGVLLKQQGDIATRHIGSQLQVTVFLCRDGDANPSCVGAATDEQKQAIEKVIEDNPETESVRFEPREEAFDKVKELLGEDQFDGPNPAMTAADMPESFWITLKDPEEFEGVKSAVIGLDGVSQIRDEHQTVEVLYEWLDAFQYGSWGIAGFLLVAALMLVANTIRLAAFARRKEIAIMRLVGASTLYIALPFLLESVVTAVVGVVLAGGALGAFMYFGVQERIADSISFMPWIDMSDYTTSLAVIAVVGPLLTLVPTLLLTRKYLKV